VNCLTAVVAGEFRPELPIKVNVADQTQADLVHRLRLPPVYRQDSGVAHRLEAI
jgi:hypothetical protein